MKTIVKSKNMNVSDALREKAEKKIGKFDKFFRPDTEVSLSFNHEKDRYIFEATLFSRGMMVRAEDSAYDIITAIDLVVEKLERQIRKHKTKLGRKIHQEAMVPENFEIDEEIDEESHYSITKIKKFPLKPMDPEEAALQMNLLGHSFFVFMNSDTEKVNVVYKRNDGFYGLLEPED